MSNSYNTFVQNEDFSYDYKHLKKNTNKIIFTLGSFLFLCESHAIFFKVNNYKIAVKCKRQQQVYNLQLYKSLLIFL